MENTRAISIEGKSYNLKDNHTILKEYLPTEAKKAANVAVNKAMAHPEAGFTTIRLENKNTLLIVIKK